MRAMSVQVTVFSRTGCVQCNATYRALDGRGVEYQGVHGDVLRGGGGDRQRALGFLHVPVVKVEGAAAWSGFRPDLIAGIEVAA